MSVKDLTNLPAQVLARLEARGVDPFVVTRGGRLVEVMRFVPSEIRFDEGGNPTVDGYATTYEDEYDVAGGAPYGWSETIARGAADKSVKERDDVRLLVNHEGLALAITKSNTLSLASDKTGLRSVATLDGSSPTVQSLVSAMQRGDMDEMSFAFRAIRQEWNEDYTERRILEVKLYDVSVVTYPANPATSVHVRSGEGAMSLSLARVAADALRQTA